MAQCDCDVADGDGRVCGARDGRGTARHSRDATGGDGATGATFRAGGDNAAGAAARAGGRAHGGADRGGRGRGVLSDRGDRAGLRVRATDPFRHRGAIPEKTLPQEGSVSFRVGEELSQALIRMGHNPHAWGGSQIWWANRRNPEATLFALNDATEETECGSINTGVETVVHALTTALSTLRDVVTPAGQVRRVHAFDLFLPLFMLLTHVFFTVPYGSQLREVPFSSQSLTSSSQSLMPGTASLRRHGCTRS